MRTTISLLAAAALTAVAFVAVAAQGDGWTLDDKPEDPCQLLLDAIFEGESVEAVAAKFGLPIDVAVPAGTATGKRLCLAQQGETVDDGVVGLAVVDDAGENVWVILGDTASTTAEADMRSLVENEGFDRLEATSYGFSSSPEASRSAQTVSLWDVVEGSIAEAKRNDG